MTRDKVILLGSYTPSGRSGAIVGVGGVSPTLTTGNHGNIVAVMEEWDDGVWVLVAAVGRELQKERKG